MDKPEHDSPLSGLPKSLSGINRATKSPGTSTPSSTSKVTARRNPTPWAPVRPEIVGSVKSLFTKPMGQGRRTTARTTPMPWSKNAMKMVKQNTAEKSKDAGYTVKTTVKPVSVVKSKKNSYTVFNPFLKFKPQFLTTRLPQTTAATTTTTVATSTPSSTRTSTAKTSTTKRAATSTSSPVSKATSTQSPATTKSTAYTTSPSTSTSSTTKSSTVPSTTTAIPSTFTSAVTSTRKQTTKNKSALGDVTTTASPSPSSTVPPGSRWWGKNAEKAIQGPKTKADEYEVKNEKSQPSYTVESSETKKINKNQPVYTVKSSHKEGSGSPDVQVKTKESSSIYRTRSSDQQKISKTESEGRVKESPFKKPVARKEGKFTRPKLTTPPSTRPASTYSYTATPSYVPTTSTSSSSARTSSTTSGPTRIASKQATDSTTTSTAPTTTIVSSTTTTTVSPTTRATSATTTKASSSHKTKSGRSKWLFETTKPTTTTTAPADITVRHSAGTTSSVRSQPPNRKPYPKSPFTKPAKVHTKSASDGFGKKKDNPESLLKDLKGQVTVTKPVTSTTSSTKTTTTTPKPTTSTDTATTTHPRLSTSTTQTPKMTTTSGVKPTPKTRILSFNLKSRDSLHKSENLIRGQNAEHKENKDSKRTQNKALRHDESSAGKGHSQSTPKETGSAPKKSILSQTLKLPDYSQDPRRRQPTKSIFSGMVGKSSPSSSTPTRTTSASTAPPNTTSRVATTTRSSSVNISARPTPKARQWQRVIVTSVKQNLYDKTFTKMTSEPKAVTPKTSITTSRNPTTTTTQSQHDTTSHTKPTTRRTTVSVTPGFKSTARIPQATKYQKNRGDLTVQAYKNLLKSSTVGGTRKASTTQATSTVTSLNKKTPTAKMTHRQSSSTTKATPTSKVTGTVSTSTLKVPDTEKSAVPDSKKKGDKSQTPSLKMTIPSTSTKKVTLPPARAETTRPSTPSRTSTHARTTSTSTPSKEAVTGRRTARPVRPPPLARRPSENKADPFRWLGVSRFTTQPPTPPRRQEEDPNIRIRVKNPFRAPSKHLQGVAPEYGGVAQRVLADHGSLKTDGMPSLGSELRWWEKAAEPKNRHWWGMGQAARASMGSFSRKTFPDWRQHEVVTRPSASSRAPGGKSSKDCDKDNDAEQFKVSVQENSNSKTLFYKDCRLGAVKT